MRTEAILTIDQSTSATKAVLFDTAGRMLHRVALEHRQYYPQPGWVEHDAIEIRDNVRKALVQVVREHELDPKQIIALAIANQRETVCVWDSLDGAPLHRALVWQDERGTELCTALRAQGNEQAVRQRSGLLIDPYFSASKLAWLVQNVDPVQEALRHGRLCVGTVDSWLIWNLTGGSVHATDASNASRTLLFNIQSCAWDEQLIRLFQISGARLPEVRNSSGHFGEWCSSELNATIPIVGVLGDSSASLFGQSGFSPGSAKTTYGTGSSVMMNAGTTFAQPPNGMVKSVGWSTQDGATYVYEGNIHSTGDTVRWVRDELHLFSTFAEAEQRAGALPDNGGVYLVPAFNGLGSPYWTHGIRAIVAGLSRGSTSDHVIRAALESIAFQVNDVVEGMSNSTEVQLQDLRADGGGSRNRWLMQFQADILRAPIEIASIADVSARGVAFMAGLSRGVWSSASEIERIAGPAELFVPQMASQIRERLISEWAEAVAQATLPAREVHDVE